MYKGILTFSSATENDFTRSFPAATAALHLPYQKFYVPRSGGLFENQGILL